MYGVDVRDWGMKVGNETGKGVVVDEPAAFFNGRSGTDDSL
jgi:hypothetical protein